MGPGGCLEGRKLGECPLYESIRGVVHILEPGSSFGRVDEHEEDHPTLTPSCACVIAQPTDTPIFEELEDGGIEQWACICMIVKPSLLKKAQQGEPAEGKDWVK